MNIEEIRKKYPQYNDMTDMQIATGLHKKHYSDMDFGEFSKKIGFGATPEVKQSEVQQPKIGALRQNPQFSDKPDFMGEAVGVPEQGARALGKIADTAFKPVSEILRSPGATYSTEDPYQNLETKGESILDMSGHAFRGALREGGASEALIDQITEREDFGDTAEAFGRIATEYGAMSGYAKGAVKLLGELPGAFSARFGLTKGVDDIRKGLTQKIRTTFEKAVRPKGAKDFKLKEKYYEKATDSTVDIIKKKNDITLTKNGVDVKGEIPETMGEWEQANWQARKMIAEKYTNMSTKAEQLKYQGDVDNLVKNLEMFIEKPSHQHGAPEMVKYAKQTLDDLKRAKANNQLTPKYMEEMIQIKNQNLRQRMNTPDAKVYQSAKVDEMYNTYMNEVLGNTIEKMGRGEGSKYRDFRRLWGAHKQVSQDISNAATRIAHQQPNSIQKLTETFTGYHFLRGIASQNPATIFAAGTSKGINAIEAFLGKPNRHVRLMFQNVDSGVRKIDALTPVIEKAIAPPKPPPKQIGWDGTFTRAGSGEPIAMGGQEPSRLMYPSKETARSTMPKQPQTTRHKAEIPGEIKKVEKNIYKNIRVKSNEPTKLYYPSSEKVRSKIPNELKVRFNKDGTLIGTF